METWRKTYWAIGTAAVAVAVSESAAGLWLHFVPGPGRLLSIGAGLSGALLAVLLVAAAACMVNAPDRRAALMGCLIGAACFLPLFILNGVIVMLVMAWLDVTGLWAYHGGQLVVPCALLMTALLVASRKMKGSNITSELTS